jgi:hypothetical protein
MNTCPLRGVALEQCAACSVLLEAIRVCDSGIFRDGRGDEPGPYEGSFKDSIHIQ